MGGGHSVYDKEVGLGLSDLIRLVSFDCGRKTRADARDSLRVRGNMSNS